MTIPSLLPGAPSQPIHPILDVTPGELTLRKGGVVSGQKKMKQHHCRRQHWHHSLSDQLLVIDTDLRKQQDADRLTSFARPHLLPGLHLISGVGLVPCAPGDPGWHPGFDTPEDGGDCGLPQPLLILLQWSALLSSSSYQAPSTPLLTLLLLNPYLPKQYQSSLHQLFLSLLVDT